MSLKFYIAKRLLQLPLIVLIVICFTFMLVHLSGDPAAIMAGELASVEYVEKIREKYGFNKPIIDQLQIYLSKILHGDLGYSLYLNRPVLHLIVERIPATLILVLTSEVLGVIVGVLLGTYAARKYPSKTDTALTMTVLGMYSMPIFWFGLLLLLIFSVRLAWFPVSGMTSVIDGGLLDVVWHAFLPVVALTFQWNVPIFMRITRASVIETRTERFVTTARAKGLTENAVFVRHVLRNALLPSVTMAGLTVGRALSGALMTETVFGWPGMGRLMFEACYRRDYPLAMGIFIIVSICVIVATLITDIIYVYLDPRLKYE